MESKKEGVGGVCPMVIMLQLGIRSSGVLLYNRVATESDRVLYVSKKKKIEERIVNVFSME